MILLLTNIRKKKKAFDFVKVILKYAFSQAGVIVLCIVYAVVGAEMYMSMEVPLEDQQKQLKMNAALVGRKKKCVSIFACFPLCRTSLTPLNISPTAFGI